jgi:hypothetical protein
MMEKVKPVAVPIVIVKTSNVVCRVVFKKISVDIATLDDNELCAQVPKVAGEVLKVKLATYRRCRLRIASQQDL